MATVDKLTLELDAEGVDKFIRSMNDAEKQLKSIQDAFIKTAKEKGLMEKKLDKTSKKKETKRKQSDKVKEKASNKFNKNMTDSAKSLDKMLKTMLAISGISFGLNGLMNKADWAAKTGTDLGNKAINSTASVQDFEAAQTALNMAGYDKNALDNLINKLSVNQSNFLAGRGGLPEIQEMFAQLKGYDKSGIGLERQNTDPLSTIETLAKILQNNSKEDRISIINALGLDSNAAGFMSNSNVFGYMQTGRNLAINTDKTVANRQANNASFASVDKGLDNQLQILGDSFAPIRIKLTQLATKILAEVNKMTPDIEAAMPALSKIADIIFQWTKTILEKLKDFGLDTGGDNSNKGSSTSGNTAYDSKYNEIADEYIKSHPNLTSGEMNVIKERAGYINSVSDREVSLSKGTNYDKEKYFSVHPKYLEDFFKYVISENQGSQFAVPETGQQLMQSNYSNQTNNSSSQSIYINEVHLETDAQNAEQLSNDLIGKTRFLVGSPNSLMPHLNNTK